MPDTGSTPLPGSTTGRRYGKDTPEYAALLAHARGQHKGLATRPLHCPACKKFGPNGERYGGRS